MSHPSVEEMWCCNAARFHNFLVESCNFLWLSPVQTSSMLLWPLWQTAFLNLICWIRLEICHYSPPFLHHHHCSQSIPAQGIYLGVFCTCPFDDWTILLSSLLQYQGQSPSGRSSTGKERAAEGSSGHQRVLCGRQLIWSKPQGQRRECPCPGHGAKEICVSALFIAHACSALNCLFFFFIFSCFQMNACFVCLEKHPCWLSLWCPLLTWLFSTNHSAMFLYPFQCALVAIIFADFWMQ